MSGFPPSSAPKLARLRGADLNPGTSPSGDEGADRQRVANKGTSGLLGMIPIKKNSANPQFNQNKHDILMIFCYLSKIVLAK
jgi:hypothetical protein